MIWTEYYITDKGVFLFNETHFQFIRIVGIEPVDFNSILVKDSLPDHHRVKLNKMQTRYPVVSNDRRVLAYSIFTKRILSSLINNNCDIVICNRGKKSGYYIIIEQRSQVYNHNSLSVERKNIMKTFTFDSILDFYKHINLKSVVRIYKNKPAYNVEQIKLKPFITFPGLLFSSVNKTRDYEFLFYRDGLELFQIITEVNNIPFKMDELPEILIAGSDYEVEDYITQLNEGNKTVILRNNNQETQHKLDFLGLDKNWKDILLSIFDIVFHFKLTSDFKTEFIRLLQYYEKTIDKDCINELTINQLISKLINKPLATLKMPVDNTQKVAILTQLLQYQDWDLMDNEPLIPYDESIYLNSTNKGVIFSLLLMLHRSEIIKTLDNKIKLVIVDDVVLSEFIFSNNIIYLIHQLNLGVKFIFRIHSPDMFIYRDYAKLVLSTNEHEYLEREFNYKTEINNPVFIFEGKVYRITYNSDAFDLTPEVSSSTTEEKPSISDIFKIIKSDISTKEDYQQKNLFDVKSIKKIKTTHSSAFTRLGIYKQSLLAMISKRRGQVKEEIREEIDEEIREEINEVDDTPSGTDPMNTDSLNQQSDAVTIKSGVNGVGDDQSLGKAMDTKSKLSSVLIMISKRLTVLYKQIRDKFNTFNHSLENNYVVANINIQVYHPAYLNSYPISFDDKGQLLLNDYHKTVRGILKEILDEVKEYENITLQLVRKPGEYYERYLFFLVEEVIDKSILEELIKKNIRVDKINEHSSSILYRDKFGVCLKYEEIPDKLFNEGLEISILERDLIPLILDEIYEINFPLIDVPPQCIDGYTLGWNNWGEVTFKSFRLAMCIFPRDQSNEFIQFINNPYFNDSIVLSDNRDTIEKLGDSYYYIHSLSINLLQLFRKNRNLMIEFIKLLSYYQLVTHVDKLLLVLDEVLTGDYDIISIRQLTDDQDDIWNELIINEKQRMNLQRIFTLAIFNSDSDTLLQLNNQPRVLIDVTQLDPLSKQVLTLLFLSLKNEMTSKLIIDLDLNILGLEDNKMIDILNGLVIRTATLPSLEFMKNIDLMLIGSKIIIPENYSKRYLIPDNAQNQVKVLGRNSPTLINQFIERNQTIMECNRLEFYLKEEVNGTDWGEKDIVDVLLNEGWG
ncbi:MAG: hypothetical protein OEZ01_02895 [Candidatus Heimdallarchaeota archaeon]|nr:hypothetical protein [Candidatus Heimdallarchaeota archaeon]MDH5644925.1 hypothetical protein [Candidatus Heimdallarchaeota archaeon]